MMSDPFKLSSRADYLLSTPAHPYQWNHIKATFNQYEPENNPDGELPLAIAENKLCNDILMPRLKQAASSTMNEDCLSYTNGTGAPDLKNALSGFLSKFIFTNKSDPNPFVIDDEDLVVSGGCTALLYKLSILLFEPGDSVLIPIPYYSAFGRDFANIGSVHVHPIVPPTPWAGPGSGAITRDTLNLAYTRAEAAGHPPKAVLISNPHNPLGVIYSAAQLQLLLDWTRERGLHFVVDEIYALSVFSQGEKPESDAATSVSGDISQGTKPESDAATSASGATATGPTEFTSIVSMLDNKLPGHVHVLWGLSKDFGGSGLRLGVLYSQNRRLLSALGAIDAFQVSRALQMMVADVLRDHVFCAQFIKENATRIKRSHDVLMVGLAAVGISVVGPPVGTTFVFADFRPFIFRWQRHRMGVTAAADTEADALVVSEELELAFYNDVLCERLRLLLTPSDPCHLQTEIDPASTSSRSADKETMRVFGYYRICYTWVPLSGVSECCKRLLDEFNSYE